MAGSSQQAEQDMHIRRANSGDVQKLSLLAAKQRDAFNKQFGKLRIDQLVETAFLTLVAEVQGSVVAFASLTDVPTVPDLDASVAIEYLQQSLNNSTMTVSFTPMWPLRDTVHIRPHAMALRNLN